MKRRKTLIIALIIVAALVAALVGINALNAYQEKKAAEAEEAEKNAEPEPLEITTFRLMDGVETEQVRSVEWNFEGKTYSFTRDGADWSCPEGIPLDVDYCNARARAVAYTRAAKKIDMTGVDLAEFELDKPKMDITYTLTDGTQYHIHLGLRNAVLDQNYAYIDEIEGVYLLSSNLEGQFSVNTLDLAVIDPMPKMDNVQEISLSGEVNLTFACPENYEELTYTSAYQNFLIDENGEYLEIDSGAVYDATNTLTEETFTWQDTVDYCPGGAGLDQYGLDNPRLTVHVNYSTDQEDEEGNYTESIDGEVTFHFGDAAGEGLIYAQPAGSDFVYTLPSDEADYLLALKADEMLTRYVCLIEFDALLKMDVSVSGGPSAVLEITRDSAGQATDYTIDGVSVDRETLRSLYYEIFSLEQDARVWDSARSTDDAYVTVTFTRDRADQYREMTLYLIPYDDDFYIADFNGQQQQLINKRKVETFVSDLQAQLDNQG